MRNVFMYNFHVNTGDRLLSVAIYVNDSDGSPVLTFWDQKADVYLRPMMDQSSVEFYLSRWTHLRDVHRLLRNDRAYGDVMARCFAAVQNRTKELVLDERKLQRQRGGKESFSSRSLLP